MNSKQKIINFLKTQKLAVVSTVNSDSFMPESALIAFVEDEKLNLFFQTGKHTRKAQNLKKNKYVSLVIGLNQKEKVTIQYEGKAKQITNKNAISECKRMFLEKNSPTTEEYLEHPTAIFFKVIPTWIGCSDYSGKKPSVFEIQDFQY